MLKWVLICRTIKWVTIRRIIIWALICRMLKWALRSQMLKWALLWSDGWMVEWVLIRRIVQWVVISTSTKRGRGKAFGANWVWKTDPFNQNNVCLTGNDIVGCDGPPRLRQHSNNREHDSPYNSWYNTYTYIYIFIYIYICMHIYIYIYEFINSMCNRLSCTAVFASQFGCVIKPAMLVINMPSTHVFHPKPVIFDIISQQ